MNLRERSSDHDQPRPPSSTGPDGPDDEGLSEIRAAGEAFLAAGDDAISRALSSDSEAFLSASRQMGGQ